MAISFMPLTVDSSRIGLKDSSRIALDETDSRRTGNAAEAPMWPQNVVVCLEGRNSKANRSAASIVISQPRAVPCAHIFDCNECDEDQSSGEGAEGVHGGKVGGGEE
jgi:hypothetical protein